MSYLLLLLCVYIWHASCDLLAIAKFLVVLALRLVVDEGISRREQFCHMPWTMWTAQRPLTTNVSHADSPVNNRLWKFEDSSFTSLVATAFDVICGSLLPQSFTTSQLQHATTGLSDCDLLQLDTCPGTRLGDNARTLWGKRWVPLCWYRYDIDICDPKYRRYRYWYHILLQHSLAYSYISLSPLTSKVVNDINVILYLSFRTSRDATRCNDISYCQIVYSVTNTI